MIMKLKALDWLYWTLIQTNIDEIQAEKGFPRRYEAISCLFEGRLTPDLLILMRRTGPICFESFILIDVELRELSRFSYSFAALIEEIAVIFRRKLGRRDRRRASISSGTLTGGPPSTLKWLNSK